MWNWVADLIIIRGRAAIRHYANLREPSDSLHFKLYCSCGLQECLCVTKSWSEMKIKAFTCNNISSPVLAGQTKTNLLHLKIKCDDATLRRRWYLTKIFVDSRFLFNEHGTSPDIICKTDPEVSAYKQLTLKHKWSWRHFTSVIVSFTHP